MIREFALFLGGPVGLRDLLSGRLVLFFARTALFFSMVFAATFLDKNSALVTTMTAVVLALWLVDMLNTEENFAFFAALFAVFVATEFF
jgi:hypothetical protein